ncbi:Putative allantoate permease [Komagataella phaffii CBS 7435]|uniref:Major facilitator superfamily (MFS) profile domain-containing protein n=2 Tax=Komagataella phaffii TaxID=460519 RepID=C4R418_KOMPG|nr:Putative protein with similarity to the allantoate permease (Dal5p) [Komagataella phaffii GS115]AOA64077.1 GQ67_03318T0 [Komagataella phaffii]CAH2449952.1 Putative allantoate permease [Komagataella phaffii CBS 7435]AOA68922.1 GQ68_03287T0 [Komagataella phaffii GS115]CAY70304.1 Putative protein with similarity to the allantoate permease (Dal5p) [Komagataella phaffii GS115]CCA39902.1 Putative allantoate permease [Komagataella phaffii CBS 7435]
MTSQGSSEIKQEHAAVADSVNSSDDGFQVLTIINRETRETIVIKKDWTDAEEQRLVRKLDFIITPLIFFGFFLLQLDRGNIANAYTDVNLINMLELNNYRINIASALFSLGIVIFEIPFNVALQRVSPSVFLSFQIFAWSLVATLQSQFTNLAGFYVTRFLVGALEAGYIPGCLYFLSTWYKRSELGLRHTLFFYGNLTASATSGLIAAGILRDLSGVGGMSGWQWIFFVEGIVGVGFSFIFFAFLPDSAAHPAAFWNKRWFYFTKEEARILRDRIYVDDPAKSVSTRTTNHKDVWETFKKPIPWLHVLITISSMQTTAALSSYIPLIIRSMGFGVFESNARSSIPQWCSMVLILLLSISSKHIKPRGGSIAFVLIWQLAAQIALRELPASASPTARFTALCFLVTAVANGHILNTSWLSVNIKSPRERSIALAMLIMAANIGGICGGQILRDNDRPLYRKGFLALIILDVFSVLLVFFTIWYYHNLNRKLEKLHGKEELVDEEEEKEAETVESLHETVYVGFNTSEVMDKEEEENTFVRKPKYRYIP